MECTMLIRWLGAFRKADGPGGLEEALYWEFLQTSRAAMPCEVIKGGVSHIRHPKVGLLSTNSAVVRRFKGDVWSETSPHGRTYPTRVGDPTKTRHSEAFVRPHWVGIVVRPRLTTELLMICRKVATDKNVKILCMDDKHRRLVKLEECGMS